MRPGQEISFRLESSFLERAYSRRNQIFSDHVERKHVDCTSLKHN